MPSSVPMRGLRMSDELYLKLRHIAEKHNRSYNQESVYALKSYVENYEKENGEIIVNPEVLYQ
jgi:predicted transcriptional regulator